VKNLPRKANIAVIVPLRQSVSCLGNCFPAGKLPEWVCLRYTPDAALIEVFTKREIGGKNYEVDINIQEGQEP
jgi:hypothetical protein